MCAGYVGIDTFLKGVSTYLKRYLYGNATSAELWKTISQVAHADLTTLLKEWLRQVCFFFIKDCIDMLNER
jgi:aminopeptidase N